MLSAIGTFILFSIGIAIGLFILAVALTIYKAWKLIKAVTNVVQADEEQLELPLNDNPRLSDANRIQMLPNMENTYVGITYDLPLSAHDRASLNHQIKWHGDAVKKTKKKDESFVMLEQQEQMTITFRFFNPYEAAAFVDTFGGAIL